LASGATQLKERAILNEWFGNTAPTIPATLYFGLLTDSNSKATRDAGTVTEVSTGTWTNYARVAKTNNTTNFPNATSGSPASKANGTAIDFGTATTTGNVTCTAFGVWDASSGGNLLDWGDFSTPNPIVQNGNPCSFPIGALVFTQD
jgi:hypothetical protein